MDKHLRFSKLTDTRQLSHLIRSVPDDWGLVNGYLLSPQFPTSTDPLSLSVLMISPRGFSLHRADKVPDLSGLFVGKKDIDKVVIDMYDAPSCAECRSLASGLVERGYRGVLSFALTAQRTVTLYSIGMSIQDPAHASELNVYRDSSCPASVMDPILLVCGRLAAEGL